MKELPILLLLAAATTVLAQPTPPQVTERGPHHNVWSWETESRLPDGKTRRQPHQYVEIGTGLNRLSDGKWTPAAETIELAEVGAIARSGQITARFAPNLNTFNAIRVETMNGPESGSHIIGLAYTDLASGKSVLFAEIKDCLGMVLPPNQVLYQDAFSGAQADVRYVYARASFSQIVEMKAQPPSPKEYGLDPATTVLEVWTEFPDSPMPRRTARTTVAQLKSEANPAAPAFALHDDSLDFDGSRLIEGRAFSRGDAAAHDEFAEDAVRVGKSWVEAEAEGRRFLIEAFSYQAIQAKLAAELPQAKAEPAQRRAAVQPKRTFPQAPQQARLNPVPKPMQMARNHEGLQVASTGTTAGYIIDYERVISNTNMVFRAGETYLIASTCYLDQQTVFEGGAVLKYTNTSSYLRIRGTVDCQTTPWRPVIFTSMHDNLYGETIPGSTNVPGGYLGYASVYFETANTLRNMRFLYNTYGPATSSANLDLHNIQIIRCKWALRPYGARIDAHNLLISQCDTAFYSIVGTPGCHVEQGTIDGVLNFASGYTNYLFLTNCLITAATNYVAFNGQSNTVLTTGAGVYQTVGAGSFYLADTSPYRDTGATNLSPAMRALLPDLTTYPPIVLTNAITQDTVLSPAAARDTDLPDRGYHYPAIDYAISLLSVTNNASVLVTNGACLAAFGSYGFWLPQATAWISEGSPTRRNQMMLYSSVQEQGIPWGDQSVWAFTFASVGRSSLDPMPSIRSRFTDFHFLKTGGQAPYSFFTTSASNSSWSAIPSSEISRAHRNPCNTWRMFLQSGDAFSAWAVAICSSGLPSR